MTFTALSNAQWEAIRSTRTNWPNGIDYRREIERIGQDYWDAQAAREIWVKRLQGKQPAKQREKIHKAWISSQQLRTALAALGNDGLLDDDFPYPDLESPENRLEAWLSEYDLWVRPFAGKSNPIQAELEWRLLALWKKAGGKLVFTREQEPGMRRPTKPVRRLLREPGTPYGPLIDFLTHTLHAILGRSLTPSGIAGIIDRHRGRRPPHDPFLMYAMRVRIIGS
ncbi:hypothetical protein [Bradyrhizobium sp. sBnM-33]|uniref:hypothetical protein n=1 Tax=Bradyrhizobium sp. sBnM-33 TaxID=2831780 RepID=UPI001BCD3BAF|nr:hypothetical protein [Bradyrhizobium sp. sBnM-33]WOH51916.1 hypothetical protein RX328_06500 [Bradyrhizobium sp. sBnM-33]